MEQGNELSSLKRKQVKFSEESELKRPKLCVQQTGILDLSDCVLFILLSYMDATSLYFISQSCKRLHYLVKDPRFWRCIEARWPPNSLEKVRFCEQQINDRTTHILFSADSRTKEIVSSKFFTNQCVGKNLQVLALENQYINGNYFPLRTFPSTLQELSLRKTFVTGGCNFFRFARNLENLRVLILDHCQWVETSNIMSIANFKNLEILSLYMCKKLSDTNIGYISLSGIYGFKNLKILNARFTGLGNQLLSSLYKSSTLQELYFQGYSATYDLEKSQRRLSIMKGAKVEPFSYISDDDEHYDTNVKYLRKRFGHKESFSTSCMDVLDDSGIFTYKNVEMSSEETRRPRSVLFKDPYGECRCGHYTDFWESGPSNKELDKNTASQRGSCNNSSKNGDSSSDDSDDDSEKSKLKALVRKRKRQLKRILKTRDVPPLVFANYNCVPFITHGQKSADIDENYKESVPSDVNFQWIYHREPSNEFEVAQLEHSVLNVNLVHSNHVLVLDIFRRDQNNMPSFSELQDDGQMVRLTPHVEDTLECPSCSMHSDTSDDEDVCTSAAKPKSSPPRPVDLMQVPQHLRITMRQEDNKIRSCMKRLSLRGFPRITDSSLEYLSKLKLELLDVQHTNVTAEGVRFFMLAHPECRVVHDSACVCGPNMHF